MGRIFVPESVNLRGSSLYDYSPFLFFRQSFLKFFKSKNLFDSCNVRCIIYLSVMSIGGYHGDVNPFLF